MNGLKFVKQKWHSGLTDQNTLSTALMTEPEIMGRTLAYVFGDKYALQYLTQGTGRVSDKYELIGNDQYRWPLMGMLKKPIAITGAVSPAANIGLNHTTFDIPLAEKYFAVGDVLATTSRYLVRVQEEPSFDGADWIHTCQLVTSEATDSVPAAQFAVGQELSVEFTAFEEYSEGGDSKEAFPMWFTNQLTISRMSFDMTGGSATDVMVLKGKTGKELWMYEKQYQVMLQWMEETERLRWYGKYNRSSDGTVKLFGKNGRPVKIGAGVLEQIAYSNRRNYSVGTESLYREFILDLMENSKDSENKKFIAFTGIGGLEEFHTAMKEAIAAATLVDSIYVSGSGQNLTLGGQFTTYKGLIGTEFTVVHLPLFDNRVNNRELHPKTGRPLESYKMVILDFGMMGGESNISMVAKGADGIDRSFLSWYTAGSQTPNGAEGASGDPSFTSKVMRSNSLDGWSCHFLSETGIKVINPLSCGILEMLVA
jgi:hypothetical protein